MKYIIYCRKSSEEESKQIQSLETQERMLLEFAQKQNLEIIEIVKESRSAKSDNNRPLFNHVLKRIEKGDADALLSVHTDRLARNLIEAGHIIKLFEQGRLKEVRTPNTICNTINSLFYISFDFLVASNMPRDLSIKVKDGIKTKLLRGEYPSYAPTGYVNSNGKIYPDPLRAHHIKKIFDLYVTGKYSLDRIVKILFDDGFRGRRGNGKVRKSVIHRILTDPVYYGAIRRNGQIYIGVHEPLITKATFELAHDLLFGKNHSKKQKHEFLYRGYLNCASCSCMLTAAHKKNGRYIYYYCTDGKKKCYEHEKYIPEAKMDNLVQELVNDFTLDKEMADLSLDLYMDELKDSAAGNINSKKVIEDQIKNIDQKLDRLLDLRLEDSIDEAKYKEKEKVLKSDKANLLISLKSIKEPDLEKTLELLTEIKNRACNFDKMFEIDDFEIKSEILNSLLWNLEIKSQKIASQQYKLPYAFLENLNKTTDIANWRRGRDLNP